MIRTERMNILEATEDDIEKIIEIESRLDTRDFLWIGTYEEHLQEIGDPNHRLLVFKDFECEETMGYALIRLDFKSEIFEIRRIAVIEKGMGYGRESMEALIKYAFDDLGMNRLWLDVYPDNVIGIRLYESLGMHKDGVLRQNYKADRGYLDQIIYSMLRDEYLELRRKGLYGKEK